MFVLISLSSSVAVFFMVKVLFSVLVATAPPAKVTPPELSIVAAPPAKVMSS